MSPKRAMLTLGIVVMITAIGSAVYLTNLSNHKSPADSSHETSTTTERSDSTTDSNVAPTGAINGGESIMCSISAVSAEVFFTGSAFTDGKGRAKQTYEFNKMNYGAIVEPDKTYSWTQSSVIEGANKGGVKPTTADTAKNMQFHSGEATLNGMRVRYDCQDWTVDDSVFKLPTDVEFVE